MSSMYSQYNKNPGCGNRSSMIFFVPIVFILFFATGIVKLPFWTTLFIILIMMKFLKFGFFGSRRNSHFYGPSTSSRQSQYGNQKNQPPNNVEVEVDFEQESTTKQSASLKFDNATQFCIECGIKLPQVTKFCNNCGTLQLN